MGSALLVQAPLPRLAPKASPALPCHGVSHSTTPSGRGWPSSAPCVTSEQGDTPQQEKPHSHLLPRASTISQLPTTE